MDGAPERPARERKVSAANAPRAKQAYFSNGELRFMRHQSRCQDAAGRKSLGKKPPQTVDGFWASVQLSMPPRGEMHEQNI